MWHCWRSPAFLFSNSSRRKMSLQKCCLSLAVHCGPKQPDPSLRNQNLSLLSYLCVYYMSLTPGYKIHEAQCHVCLVAFCFLNINTRHGIIIIITFTSTVTIAGIDWCVQCIRHCKKGFLWNIPNPRGQESKTNWPRGKNVVWSPATSAQEPSMLIPSLGTLHQVP